MPEDETAIPESFGAALRRARMARGMSLRELGGRTHYSKGHLSKIENGFVGANLALARACDTALAADGELASAFLAGGSRRGPAPVPPPDGARPGAPDILSAFSLDFAAQAGGRSRDASRRRLVAAYAGSASAADQVISPGRYIPGTSSSPPFAGAVDARAWCEEMAGVVPLVCSLAFDMGMDDECWRLAYAFRGYFFTTRALGPWVSSHKIALQAAERAGDRWAQAVTRNNLGMALLEQGLASAAEAAHRTALGLFRGLGDDHGVATTLGHQAWASHAAGSHAAAVDLATRANVINRRHDNQRSVAIMDRTAALAHSRLAQHADALRCLAECQEILACHDFPLDHAMLLNCRGEVHFGRGQFQSAARCHARAAEQSAACGGLAEQARSMRLYRRAASMSSTFFASP